MQSDISYLKETWNLLTASQLNGVHGIYVVDSGIKGPTVGITIMTHGNEPSGLAAARYFLNENFLSGILQKGRVIFVINNLEASKKFWEALANADAEAASMTRSIDVNMNRLPDQSLGGDTSEERRARELLPIWKMFDYALDIHSTTQPTQPIAILGNGLEAENLCRSFDLDKVLGNMLNIQSGFPAIAFYGHGNTSTIGVEVGDHYNPQSIQRAVQISADFLFSLGLIPHAATDIGYTREFDEKYLYTVYGKVVIDDPKGELTKIFKNFEPIKKGDILAVEAGKTHIANQNGYALFGLPQVTVKYPGEEALFLLTERTLLSSR